MFQWWNELMTFVRDWPALFLLIAALLVVTLIVGFRRGNTLRKAHTAEIEDRKRSHNKLSSDYAILRDLSFVLNQAVSGGRHLYDAPMHVTSDQDGYRLKGVQKELSRLLTNEEQSLHLKATIVKELQFVFLLNSVDFMRDNAEALVESKNTSEDLSRFMDDFDKILNELEGYLVSRFGSDVASRYLDTQRHEMRAILAKAHAIQAEVCVRWIDFGSQTVSMVKVCEFLNHCTAAVVEPHTLVDSKYHAHLDLLVDAIAKINEQADLEPDPDAMAS